MQQPISGRVAKLVDASDLKSLELCSCRFKSGRGHHFEENAIFRPEHVEKLLILSTAMDTKPLSCPSPSSRGLGHRPFTAATRVRIP